ncbi:MAG: type II toxin-antitoxin system RelE/ParE family toxin [Candidatus Magasanikiibacteriota bacterium]
MSIVFLDDDVENFIYSLENKTKAKVLRTLDLLEEFGYNLGMPHTKKIKNNLFELRVLGRNQVRLFYTFLKPNIIVLCGFRKKTQKIPSHELEKALHKLKLLDKI